MIIFHIFTGSINYSAFSSIARFQASILLPFGIYCLDFVREIALLGIFLMNSVLFACGFTVQYFKSKIWLENFSKAQRMVMT